jgi:hypothetical protein
MDIDSKSLQYSYDRIYSFFKTTSEPFDFLEWDGKVISVIYNNAVVETYGINDFPSENT